MNKLMKIKYIIAVLVSVGIFNSCSGIFLDKKNNNQNIKIASHYHVSETSYGSYLAARVAHIRQNYNLAADYYIKSIKLGVKDPELLSRVYLLLTTEGRIDEAAKYAQQSIKEGDSSNFVRFVLMSNEAKNQNFDKAIEYINGIKDKSYKNAISPLFKAWLLAGKNDKKGALRELNLLEKDKDLLSFYHMHKGMILDYFNDTESAQKEFDKIIDDQNLEISFRSLQIIANFYARNSQVDKAKDIIKQYNNKNSNTKMFTELLSSIYDINKNKPIPVIDTPQKGLSEAIFNVGVIFRDYQSDIAQIFTALSLYLNKDNDVARISMADLLEKSHRYSEAIKQYEKVSVNSPLYYMANLKISAIYLENKDHKEALQKLKELLSHYPNDYNILFNLGEVSRITDKNKDAIKYYNLALKKLPDSLKEDWTVYYALGIAYEKSNQWEKAEQSLKKALKISKRHPFVLNYLGYIWLENNQNYNEALYMIFDAYRQNPENGHIMDSMGWALYRMGKYTEALSVLERAAEYLPANAVVCDHLGDVYWQTGRKSEAKYQWQHALSLKEDAELLDKDVIRKKIAEGVKKPTAIIFNESLLIERLKGLKK